MRIYSCFTAIVFADPLKKGCPPKAALLVQTVIACLRKSVTSCGSPFLYAGKQLSSPAFFFLFDRILFIFLLLLYRNCNLQALSVCLNRDLCLSCLLCSNDTLCIYSCYLLI